jgi:threonine/homoserine/homoserine lactone efflux protein
MNPIIEGAILGLTLAVLLGPALFALIQTSIHRGFRSGVFMAIGIFFSDITLVFLCYMGAMRIISSGHNRLIFGIIAGAILIIYGVVAFIRHVKINGNGNNTNGNSHPGWVTFVLKGYFLNVANPYVWLFWMTVTVGVTSDYGDDNIHSATMFFTGALLMILITDIVKAYVAKKIKTLLNEKNVRRLNKVVGILLFFFGIVLIARAIMSYYAYI